MKSPSAPGKVEDPGMNAKQPGWPQCATNGSTCSSSSVRMSSNRLPSTGASLLSRRSISSARRDAHGRLRSRVRQPLDQHVDGPVAEASHRLGLQPQRVGVRRHDTRWKTNSNSVPFARDFRSIASSDAVTTLAPIEPFMAPPVRWTGQTS